MPIDNWPVSRRDFVRGVGAGTASLVLASAQAAADSQANQNPPVEDVTVLNDVDVPMRDGTELSTDIYLPDLPGKSERTMEFPTLLTRTPYNKEFSGEQAKVFARHKYAVVVQDVRGKFASEGVFYPYRSGPGEGQDTFDTVEWAATQPWSNGNVGTYGISYVAGTQWALVHLDELPPHLVAMAPGFAVASYYGQGAYSGGAALLSHNLDYLNGFAIERYNRENPQREEEFTFLEAAQEAMPQLHWDLPVVPYEPMQRAGYPWLEDWHTHETYGDYWETQDHTRHYEKVDVPVLNYGGWYDIFNQGTVWNFQGLRDETDAPTGLIMGPYTHGDNALRAQGAVMGHAYRFPENATFDETALLLSWFERFVKDDCQTVEDPRVRVYVPGGLDEWVGAEEFPLPETEFTKYYLHSEGDANIQDIDDDDYRYQGRLSTDPPGAEPPDEYVYDPADPVVTVAGFNTHWQGGVNDRTITYQNRDDILVYETEILEEDVAVVGPITATLYASTSAKDTDFMVTVSDVDPIDRAGGIFITEGARRGRIGDVSADPREQETYAEVNLLEPGEVYEWKIAVWPTSRVFEAGRRIRIDVTSSDFPRYSRNLGTGEGLTGTEHVEAEQTVYHDAEHPSHVELPIVPVDALEERVIEGPVPGRENGGRPLE